MTEKIKKENEGIYFIDNIVKKRNSSNFSNTSRLINKTGVGIDPMPVKSKKKEITTLTNFLKFEKKNFLKE